MTRPHSILLWGYCQSQHLGRILNGMPYIAGRFDVCAIEICADPVTGLYRTPPPDILERCEFLYFQVNAADPIPDYIERLIRQGKSVHFPVAICQPLWPQHTDLSRQLPEPGLPWGRFPYADRALLDLMETGRDDDAIVQEYLRMDVAEAFGADRLADFWKHQMEQLDEGCDVPMAAFIWERWKRERLYWAINHPTNRILGHVLREMFARTIGRVPEEEVAESLRVNELDEFMPPVHPSVARRFGLEWYSEDQLYNWPDGPFTLEQWALEHLRYARKVLAV